MRKYGLAVLVVLGVLGGAVGEAKADPLDREMYVIAAGHYAKTHACSGICVGSDYLWVDVAVRNRSFQKEVWIEYAKSIGGGRQRAAAYFAETMPGGYERWHVELAFGSWGPYGHEVNAAQVNFDAYASRWVDGQWQTVRDEHGGYGLLDRVYPGRAVKVTPWSAWTAPLAVGADGQVEYRTTIDVFPFAEAEHVTAVYSTDGWKTVKYAAATQVATRSWELVIGGLGRDVLPEALELAIVYRAGGREQWDSNGGFNHHVALEPVLGFYALAQQPTLYGNQNLWFDLYSHMERSSLRYRVDGGAWIPLAGTGFELDVIALANGGHTVEVGAGFLGDAVDRVYTLPFAVDKTIVPDAEIVVPSLDEAHPLLLDVAADGNGWLALWGGYLDVDTVVAEYASLDALIAGTPTRVFAEVPGFAGKSLARDAAGRVWVAGIEGAASVVVQRFTADGAHDDRFALHTPTAGYYFEVYEPALDLALAEDGSAAYVTRARSQYASEQALLWRVADDGTVAPAVVLGDWWWDGPFGLEVRDGLVWIKMQDSLRVFADAAGSLEDVSTIALDLWLRQGASMRNERIHAFASAPDGSFWLADDGRIARFEAPGGVVTRLGLWQSTGTSEALGNFGDVVQLVIDPAGTTVLALERGTNTLLRFSASVARSPRSGS